MGDKVNRTHLMSPSTAAEKAEIRGIPYRELGGSLIYLVICTRPDLAVVVALLSQFMGNPGKEHWAAAQHVLRYLHSTLSHGLFYQVSEKQ